MSFHRSNSYTSRVPQSAQWNGNFSDGGPVPKRKRAGKRNHGNPGGSSHSRTEHIEPLFKEPISPSRNLRGRSPRSGGRDAYHPNTSSRSRQDFPDRAESSWYWNNYNKSCQSWKEKHQLAYYRSRCLALEFENQMLFEQINTLVEENCIFAAERGEMPSMRLPELNKNQIDSSSGRPVTNTPPSKRQNKKAGNVSATTAVGEPSVSNEARNLEFEVTPELLDIMETSIRHKIDLKQSKKMPEPSNKPQETNGGAVKKESAKPDVPHPSKKVQHEEQLKQLYGENASMIQKLETAFQLNYNRVCDTNRPAVWMAVPLNPETYVAD